MPPRSTSAVKTTTAKKGGRRPAAPSVAPPGDAAAGAELVVAAPDLPGARAPDDALLDKAVPELNALYAAKGLETARVIGEYVLATFFGGNPKNFADHGGEHVTFRRLADRDDLQIGYATLWRMVSVVEQLRLLPDNIAGSLPFTHHTLLLPLKDEKTKIKLATKAAHENWSKRKLEDAVRDARDKEKDGNRTGRPPLPRFVKTIHSWKKLFEKGGENGDPFGDTDAVDEMSPEEALTLWKAVTGMKLKCEELQKVLDKKASGFRPPQGE